jgi:hypothetical protein
MNKALCVAVLLLGTIALTNRNSTASPVGPAYPLIVAKAKLLNQTAQIPTTTIYTPAQSGLYRLSVYATIISGPCEGNSNYWDLSLIWTDDSGAQSGGGSILESDIGDCPGSLMAPDTGGSAQGATVTFEAKSETAITYNMRQGAPDGSVYDLYYTLERLE